MKNNFKNSCVKKNLKNRSYQNIIFKPIFVCENLRNQSIVQFYFPADDLPPQPRRLEVVSKQATRVTALSTKLEWKIEQFEKLMKLVKNGSNLISRMFSVPEAPTVCWELHVYPNGKREEDSNNVSFFLRQVGLAVSY